jgi:protein-S-isoprenylcysteine O-methyltransferase Ste14
VNAIAPAARSIYWTTLFVWFIAEYRQSQRTRTEATTRDAGSRGLMGVTLVIAVTASIFTSALPWAHMGGRPFVVFAIGMAVMWTGMGLRFWAFRTLGRYFTFSVMTSAEQSVVSNGPYRLLRHPSYAGSMLILTGIGLVQRNWLSLAIIVLVPLIGTINRIRVEEDALLTELGDRYRAYASGRKRLVPFVW